MAKTPRHPQAKVTARPLHSLAASMLLLGVTAAAVPASALAETIRITFDFGGSSVDLLGGAIVTPPDGEVTSATATFDFTGTEKGEVTEGPVVLRAFSLDVDIDANVLGLNAVTGFVIGDQVGTTSGSVSGDLATLSFSQDMTVDLEVDVQCVGPQCGAIGNFPAQLDEPVVFTQLGALTLTGIALGVGEATGAFDIEVAGMQGTLHLAGIETARTVPEPAAAAAIALLTLTLWRARRRSKKHV